MKDIPNCFLDPISQEFLFEQGVKIFTAEDGHTYTEKTIEFLRKQYKGAPVPSQFVPDTFIGLNLVEGNHTLQAAYDQWTKQRLGYVNARNDLATFYQGTPSLSGIIANNHALEAENEALRKELAALRAQPYSQPAPKQAPPAIPYVSSKGKLLESQSMAAVRRPLAAVQSEPSVFFGARNSSSPRPTLTHSVSLSAQPIKMVRASANGQYTALATENASSSSSGAVYQIQVFATADLNNPLYTSYLRYTAGQAVDFILSNDGQYMAYAASGQLKLYRKQSADMTDLGNYHADKSPPMQFSPDSTFLAVAGLDNHKTGISIFSKLNNATQEVRKIAYTGQEIVQDSFILDLQFAPYGALCSLQLFYDKVVGKFQSRLCLWDIESGWCTPYEFAAGYSPSRIVYQSGDKNPRFLLIDRAQQIFCCDLSSFDDINGRVKPCSETQMNFRVGQMAISEDGSQLAMIDPNQGICLFQIAADGKLNGTHLIPGTQDAVFFNQGNLVYHTVNSTILEKGPLQMSGTTFRK